MRLFGGRFALLAAVTLALSASPCAETRGDQSKTRKDVSPPAEILTELRGSLVLGGGGTLTDAIRDRFLALGGGKDARLVVLVPPSNRPDPASVERTIEVWKGLAANVEVVQVANMTGGQQGQSFQQLRVASGVWIEGNELTRNDQLGQMPQLRDELAGVLNRGGVIGTMQCSSCLGARLVLRGHNSPECDDGLNLLPSFLVETGVLKRNRADRLTNALARNPGYIGLGIDENTAVVAKGRRLSVVGDSYAVICQAASATRPAGFRILKQRDEADLFAESRSARSRCQPPFPPPTPEPSRLQNGTLIIGGGGGTPPGTWERFISLAGGPDALIIVVPTALEDPLPDEPGEVRALKRSGAKNIRILHTRSRAEADRPEFAAVLKEARGVWFSGGRQWRFVDAYEGTLTEKGFHEVLARGGVIGGSSAGASIQSEYMPRGDPLGNLNIIAEGYERGFGFLKGVAVDQHFFARRRLADMSDLIRTYPQLLGIGIDEGTLILVQGSTMEVIGRSKVAVYDARKPRGNDGKDYEELPAGTRYDLVKRKRID